MIISGGVNIYPMEIEAELLRAPGVADCAVFGIPNEEFGEQVHAVVQPMADTSLSEEALRAFLHERGKAYKVPKRLDFASYCRAKTQVKSSNAKLRNAFWKGLVAT